jgi:hypothetical protein
MKLLLRIFFDRNEQPLRDLVHHRMAMYDPLAIILKPIFAGWAVCLTDGRELMRFRGLGARRRALRFVYAQVA